MKHKIDNNKIYLVSGVIISPKHKLGLAYVEEKGINWIEVLELCGPYNIYECYLASTQDKRDNEHNREVRWLSLEKTEKKKFEDLVARVKDVGGVILNRKTVEKYLRARKIGESFAPLYKEYWAKAEKIGFSVETI